MADAATYPSLAGRGVLITGGGSGIGEAIVRAFAGQGARVGFVDVKVDESRRLVDALTASGRIVHFAEADLTDIATLQRAVAQLRAAIGPITILVNNAAHDQRHTIEEVTPDYFDNRVAVNLRHQFFAAQSVIPDMRAAGGGAIVNFGSVSWRVAQGGMPVYLTCKAAVEGLTRALARDLGPDNIRVNAVVPGWIITERQRQLWLTPEEERSLLQKQALKRLLQPDEIAKLVLFLASDEASACTSQAFVADGGWT